jgi:hypothetical protein
MLILKNTPGNKSCYCWDGDVLVLKSKVGKWQDVIFGYYNDGQTDAWCVGVKRNGETNGRSAFFYQILVDDLADIFLSQMISDVSLTADKAILQRIRKILQSKNSEITSVHDLLQETL